MNSPLARGSTTLPGRVMSASRAGSGAACLALQASMAIVALLILPEASSADENANAPDQAARATGNLDPCRGDSGHEDERLDKLRQGVFTSVCASSRWFDSLFGDAREYSEYPRETYGRVGIGAGWNKVDGVGFDGHFRANVHLPALGDRFNAVIGRETEESFVNDNFDDIGYLPGSFSDDRDANWYAGLNYGAVEGTNSRFDVSAGVQLRIPVNPYVKARYRYYMRPSEHVLVTARTTGFWENTDGFGVTLALDTDWSITEGELLRWANTFTRSEATDGIRWKTQLAFYDALSERSALRYEATLRGETQGIQPYLKELKVTYRRSVWREWFFVETYGGVFWADDENPDKRCDGCALVGIGFEMMFGDRYDRVLASAADDPPDGQDSGAAQP
jgi:hypothetical protein